MSFCGVTVTANKLANLPISWIYSRMICVHRSSRDCADRSPSQTDFTRGLLRVRAAPHRRVLVAARRRIAGAPKDLVDAPFTSSQVLSAGRTRPQMSAPKSTAAKKVRAKTPASNNRFSYSLGYSNPGLPREERNSGPPAGGLFRSKRSFYSRIR